MKMQLRYIYPDKSFEILVGHILSKLNLILLCWYDDENYLWERGLNRKRNVPKMKGDLFLTLQIRKLF